MSALSVLLGGIPRRRLLAAGLWFAAGLAALAATLDPATYGGFDMTNILLGVVPQVVVGLACLHGRGLLVAVLAVPVFLWNVIVLALTEFDPHGFVGIWGYALLAATGALIVWGILALRDFVRGPAPLSGGE